MKNLNCTARKAPRLAAAASLALVAMVSSAPAQQVVPFSETVILRTGTDAGGAPLSPGGDDGNITQTDAVGSLVSLSDFSAADNGGAAKVIAEHSAWTPTIGDPDARWIHSDHFAAATDGTGTPSSNVLYAQNFSLPAHMPADAVVTVEMEFAADDSLGSTWFNQMALSGFSGGGYSASQSRSVTDLASNLGLDAGQNTLYVQQLDSGGHYSGMIYSLSVKVEYCVVELDLRSGVSLGAAGPVDLFPGDQDLDIRCALHTLFPSAAYGTLSGGGGNAPFRVLPHVSWVAGLSDTAGWIHVYDSGETGSFGSGRPARSVLYAHDFLLPSIPSDALVSFELEWAADETLFGVSINQDVTTPGGQLQIGASASEEFSSAHTSQVIGTVQSLGLNGGQMNSLYLSTLENYPGTVAANTYNFISSGIMYIAKVTIAFNCCDPGGETTPYETFCECPIAVAPCSNVGGPGQGCANSTGSGSSLTGHGIAQLGGGSTFELHADNLPNGSVGIFIRGDNFFQAPMPFGDGLRCVGGHLKRIKIAWEDDGCADSGALPGPSNPSQPTTKYYQFWYRDVPNSQSPCNFGFNLSSAIGLSWNLPL